MKSFLFLCVLVLTCLTVAESHGERWGWGYDDWPGRTQHMRMTVEFLKEGLDQCRAEHKTQKEKPARPADCEEIRKQGKNESGIYRVYPRDHKEHIDVYCELGASENDTWMVFQRRADGSEDFYRTWQEYMVGFGSLKNEFWLGNENIHRLTSQKPQRLRIDLETFEGEKRYAQYEYFLIGSVTEYYKLLFVMDYSGTSGDSFSGHRGFEFTAKNLDRDTWGNNCAKTYKGGWWYSNCHSSNLNGRYLHGNHTSYADGIDWSAFKGYHYSMKRTVMKIQPIPSQLH